MTSAWIDAFPGLSSLDASIREPLLRDAEVIDLPAGTRVFGPGAAPRHYLLLLEGSVRVQQTAESGREIVLYRVQAGESCALTTACLMGYEDYQAEAICETAVRAVAIPRQRFDELIGRSAEFRRFVFTAFSVRVTNLLRVIEEVAFERLDIRLAQRLLELAGERRELAITHQQLAAELGSAREVISRQLGEFQRRGWVLGGRGHLALLEPDALRRLATMH